MAKAAVHFKAVVLLLLTFCLLLLPLWESVIILCFVVRYFMPISRGTKVEKMLTLAPGRYTAGFCMVAKVIQWCI